jgi:UV DNA damage repair endonuclease
MSWGLAASLELENDVALVIDIHHHWVATGEYIQPGDERVQRVIASWRGVRPAMHYSLSKEELISGSTGPITLPNMDSLLQAGFKKSKLRAHSNYMWNNAANDWAEKFRDQFDIMVESKAKNLSTNKLFSYYNQKLIH